MKRSAAPTQRCVPSPAAGHRSQQGTNNVSFKVLSEPTANDNSCDNDDQTVSISIAKKSRPAVAAPTACKTETSAKPRVPSHVFAVLYNRKSTKKHKTWEGDGVLVIFARSAVLYSSERSIVTSSSGLSAADVEKLAGGESLIVGCKEVLLDDVLSVDSFLSGKCFADAAACSSAGPTAVATLESVPDQVPQCLLRKPFVVPLRDSNLLLPGNDAIGKRFAQLYNPNSADAFLLSAVPPGLRSALSLGDEDCDALKVVVDPSIAWVLQPHQREGVSFMYECILGFRRMFLPEVEQPTPCGPRSTGAILCDEMGLGKTLQAVTLIWTLFKQTPFPPKPSEKLRGVIRRILIVCPSSLVKNWCVEFKKWLGGETKMRVFAMHSSQSLHEEYMKTLNSASECPILITSYDLLTRVSDKLNTCNFDLVVCDEAHRLKNADIKANEALRSLRVKRRILLTGTPVHNDLSDLYTLCNIVNEDVLGRPSVFRRYFEQPIAAGHSADATEEEKTVGQQRTTELQRITSRFILRRTKEDIMDYLTEKDDYIVFCLPSPIQVKLYNALVTALCGDHLVDVDATQYLCCIAAMRKLCNHPYLLGGYANATNEQSATLMSVFSKILCTQFSDYYKPDADVQLFDSGKLSVLANLLERWNANKAPQRKTVLVSNFTETLDLVAGFCSVMGYRTSRLDGSTPVTKRQDIVDQFNTASCNELHVFLLSSKAGGVGLNLVGADRLVLYDLDWNPANDAQAMARVWRQGQTRSVSIYRLVTTATIEEKILQRQMKKLQLSDSIIDSNDSKSFSAEELKELFSFVKSTETCETHELLDCDCLLNPSVDLSQDTSEQRFLGSRLTDLAAWHHYDPSVSDLPVESSLNGIDAVSFLMHSAVRKSNKRT